MLQSMGSQIWTQLSNRTELITSCFREIKEKSHLFTNARTEYKNNVCVVFGTKFTPKIDAMMLSY